jgi:AmmeMemoRadiSam system protein B
MSSLAIKGRIRQPAVADRFYPGYPNRLKQLLQDYFAAAKPFGSRVDCPKAIIAPHAGYIYSGPIAASAFAPFIPEKETIRRIVLIGPSHRIPFQGIAIPSCESYATPLGFIPIDAEGCESLRSLPQVQILDDAHAQEHSLEVELPFLQFVLNTFTLVPIVVGESTDWELSDAIDRVWGGPETRFVISSDLSHYLPYEQAVKTDRITADAVEKLQPERIGESQACGRTPIRAMLIAARGRNLQAATLDLRNSGDTAGSRDRVVGYGAFTFQTGG